MIITKQDLENYRHDKEYVKAKRERIEEQIESVQKITSSFEETRIKSAVHDRMAENLVKLMDMQNKNLEYIVREEQRLIYIEEAIEKLQPKYRNVLYKFYIEGKKMAQVAQEMRYEEKYTSVLNGQALEELKNTTKKVESRNKPM